jgi:hypothetical protein
MLGPNAITPGRKDPIGIESIFNGLVESHQGMIVEGELTSYRVLKDRSGAILGPTVLRADFNQVEECFAMVAILGGILADRKPENEYRAALPIPRG